MGRGRKGEMKEWRDRGRGEEGERGEKRESGCNICSAFWKL